MGPIDTADAKGTRANDAAETTIRAGDEATANDDTSSNGTADDATATMGRVPTAGSSGVQCQHWVKYNWTGDGQRPGGCSAKHS